MSTTRKEVTIPAVSNGKTLNHTLGYTRTNMLMCSLGVGPQIVECGVNGNKAYIVMAQYKYTLNNYPKSTILRDNVLQLIDKLHSHNIIHGDLHEENVVLNNENDIAIIDYDMAFSLDNPLKDEYVEKLFDVTNATDERIKQLDKIEILRYFEK